MCFCFLMHFHTAFHEGTLDHGTIDDYFFPNNITAGETSDYSGAKKCGITECFFFFWCGGWGFPLCVHGAGNERKMMMAIA